jgi:acetyltransferase-like isoleucine patch superfamily enzyme
MSARESLVAPTRMPVPGENPSRYSLLLNALPLLYLLGGVGAVVCASTTVHGLAVGLAWLYLLPPLVARAGIAMFGSPEGRDLLQTARGYRVWWFIAQLQVVFNRFPALEEALRIVPGLYPLWLRLWGARVSFKVYWGPGSMVTDRMLLQIGAGVVIGTRAVLSAHLACKDETGAFRVTIAPVVIGDGALIGAYAGIGPGCRIDAGSEVPAGAFLRPDTHWARDRRARTGRPRTL